MRFVCPSTNLATWVGIVAPITKTEWSIFLGRTELYRNREIVFEIRAPSLGGRAKPQNLNQHTADARQITHETPAINSRLNPRCYGAWRHRTTPILPDAVRLNPGGTFPDENSSLKSWSGDGGIPKTRYRGRSSVRPRSEMAQNSTKGDGGKNSCECVIYCVAYDGEKGMGA